MTTPAALNKEIQTAKAEFYCREHILRPKRR